MPWQQAGLSVLEPLAAIQNILNRINGGERPILPTHVVVVGGGDVAMDACRTARRLPGVPHSGLTRPCARTDWRHHRAPLE